MRQLVKYGDRGQHRQNEEQPLHVQNTFQAEQEGIVVPESHPKASQDREGHQRHRRGTKQKTEMRVEAFDDALRVGERPSRREHTSRTRD